MNVLLTLLLSINLSGTWQFSVDRSAEGVRPLHYDQTIELPGSMLTNGLGDQVTVDTRWTGSLYDSSFYFNPKMERYRVAGEMKFPFFLTPDRHYTGNAWYRRTVRVPKDWRGQRVTLFIERPHIETTLLVNGQEVGHQMSLSVPHQFDITDFVKFGKENVIEIKIYNGIENVCVGQDSHSVTDQTQGNWNGMAGLIELRNEPIFWRRRVETDVDNASARIFLNDSIYEVKLDAPIRLWSEFDPYLYTVKVNYQGREIPVTFGMRKVAVQGRDILLNGEVIKVRGTVGNCCFPETGYPPCDVESWLAVFRKCQEYGLNAMRFHSYCPPEAAFVAADQLGFYLQPEGPSWPNHGVKLGQGMAIDKYLLDECKAIIDQYGTHPSLLMMAAGNEPAGRWVPWCNMFVKAMHEYDPTRIYCDASVGGGWAWAADAEYHVKGGARGLDWDRHLPQSMDDFAEGMALPRNFKPTAEHPVNTSPIISHETGQWCAFPDFDEIDQYTGAYKAKNFEIFRDLLQENGMGSMARKFLLASGRLQTLAYKYDIERNLRTPDYAGFLLLGLNDYSGQGTALVGPLNVHWREKGYCEAKDWTEFCNVVVPLARFPRFVFSAGDTLRVGTTLYNQSRATIHTLDYAISDAQGKRCAEGQVKVGDEVTLLTGSLPTGKYSLSLSSGKYHNHWDFWIYGQEAREEAQTDGIYLCDTLDSQALDVLRQGGKVLCTAGGKIKYGNDVKHHYLPVFWNTSWFKMRPPHTTGAYIDASHPLFKGFPTDDWQDLQWWELVNRTQVMNLGHFPKEFQPIFQPIDTWHISRKVGMLLEANVLGGRLILTTMDLSSDLDHRIVARQLRHAILRYMQSQEFAPRFSIAPEILEELFTTVAPAVDMFTKDTPDELKPKLNQSTSYELTLPKADTAAPATLFSQRVDSGAGQPLFQQVEVDEKGFLLDGQPAIPVMGEIHFSRVPREEWAQELRKMRDGGVTIVSTYIFWNHHEAEEGRFDWTGNRDLRAFVQACHAAGLPVVLRVGPFCHGEVLQGGFPTWMVEKAQADPKQYKLRSLAPGFMAATRRLYEAIYAQVEGLRFRDGGPIIGMQLENECRGPWPYYKALKKMALEIGFDLPFYTRTGWPKLNGKEEFGEMLPLYGDYADGFWDRSLKDMPGAYPDAFVFKPGRISENIATETFSKEELKDNASSPAARSYPYLTCELGGGMMTAYHRRIQIFPKDALALAICKVGSGSNLPGYYMYHGGTNPGRGMAERQASPVTNYNDLPELSYDFQAPIGEMGQLNESYYWTRQFHQFLKSYGPLLRDMNPVFPATNCEDGRKDSTLRYAVRTDGERGFLFVNNYRRMQPLSAKESVIFRFTTASGRQVTFPTIDIPSDACFVLPFGIAIDSTHVIDWATAQLTTQSEEKQARRLLLEEIPGIKPQISIQGKVYTLSDQKALQVDGLLIQLHSHSDWVPAREADRPVPFSNVQKYDHIREVKMGRQKVAEQPADSDFLHASVWTLTHTDRLPTNGILEVSYTGDVARVYADGELVQDNQWNGLPMLVRCSQLKGKRVEIRVLPLSAKYPIYLQPAQRALLEAAPEGILCDVQRIVVRGGNLFGPKFAAQYPNVHDPVMAHGEDGRYYLFATGMGIQVLSSADLKEWRPEPSVFAWEEIPAWAKDSVPGYRGHTWAPDISFQNGLWHLYYSCSTFGKNGSAIGLATNRTLDPTSPDFLWEDRGPVIISHRHQDNWNAIDPNLIRVGKRGYLTFGSFWDGIQLLPLDKDLQTPVGKPQTIARRIGRFRSLAEIDNAEHYTIEGKDTIQAGDNAVEAPFIFRRGKYFYLLVSQDYCCRGKNSTYRVVYGRSRKVTGPYLDRQGLDMAQGGGTLLYGPTDRFYGIGHCAAYEIEPDHWIYLSHAYDAQHGAQAKLFLQDLKFDEEGWIVK